MPKDPNEIGALWIKQYSKGEYMTGTIDGKKVVVFRNNKKTDKQPDWRVLLSKPKPEASEDTGF